MYYVIQCRFSEFLIQLCIKKRIFFRSVQKYYYHVQKNCLFLGPSRNITIQGQGVPGVSCRAIFGVREEILIFGEIFTSALKSLVERRLCWERNLKFGPKSAPDVTYFGAGWNNLRLVLTSRFDPIFATYGTKQKK